MTQQPIVRILVVDDKQLINEGIVALLEKKSTCQVVGLALSGDACLRILQQQKVDLIILDHQMPGKSGLQTFEIIQEQYPFVKVILLTWLAEESIIRAYLKLGIHGYLLKSDTANELHFAVEQVLSGRQYFSSGVTRTLSGQPSPPANKGQQVDLSRLTPAERNILLLIGRGLSSQEISEIRHTSIKTVHRQKQNIMDKLDIHKETKLMRFAITCGLS